MVVAVIYEYVCSIYTSIHMHMQILHPCPYMHILILHKQCYGSVCEYVNVNSTQYKYGGVFAYAVEVQT
jgi:hypothetical protein